MNAFAYRDGILHVENLSLVAAAERVGTPFYCYAAGELEHHERLGGAREQAQHLLVLHAADPLPRRPRLRTRSRGLGRHRAGL